MGRQRNRPVYLKRAASLPRMRAHNRIRSYVTLILAAAGQSGPLDCALVGCLQV